MFYPLRPFYPLLRLFLAPPPLLLFTWELSCCFGMPPNLPWWLAPPPALLWLTETLVTGQGRSMESRAEILYEDGRLNWSRSFVRPVVKLELPYVISFSYVVSAAPN